MRIHPTVTVRGSRLLRRCLLNASITITIVASTTLHAVAIAELATQDAEPNSTKETSNAVADRALLLAAVTANGELADYALARGANVAAKENSEDLTPALILATRSASKDIVIKLLERNASPDITSKTGLSALMQAARSSHTEIASLLIAAGAELELRDARDGYTALLHCAAAGNLAMLENLIDAGASVNVAEQKRGLTALMMVASRRTGFQMVIDLIAAGADINASAKDGWTALMAATDQNNDDALEVLLLNGADATATTQDGRSAFSLAAASGALGAMKRLTASIDIDSGDEKLAALLGKSLHEAALIGNSNIVEHLLAIGVHTNTPDSKGHSVLHSAVLGGHETVVKALLSHSADPNVRTEKDGHTALMLAANRDMLTVVRYLLSAGADASIIATDGWTAMQAAEMVGATDIIKELNSNSSN